jgi:rfaE bifunctional protein kinase chain/domain/rfaE bifunctional protein nucleotidyltransferase chain/domain
MSENNKIFTISALEKILSEKNDESIVHCHGVFDLLHIGHIKYFEEAKSMGDKLIVTITPDRFVNKGPNRPHFNEKLRAEAVSSLALVDYVVINNWPTAIEAIQVIKPDVYVKGPDYKNYEDDVTGKIKLEEEAVKSIGGIIKFTSGRLFSSSGLINKHYDVLSEEQKEFIEQLKLNNSIQQIHDNIKKLEKLKVLLVGEVIIDDYVFCNSIGKSGKEPVLVSKKLRSEKYAGGILSVANHISQFCEKLKIITYLGDRDNQKSYILKNINNNIDLDYVKKNNSPTILKTRFVDDYTKTKIQGIYDINDENLNELEEKDVLVKLTECIEDYDVVIVVDYGHGLITPNIVKLLEEKASFLSVNTQLNSFNAAFHSISKYRRADYICVHQGELRHDYRNRNDDIKSLTKKLFNRANSKFITITLGKDGSIVFDGNKFSYCPAFASKVIDRVGAGDTLLAITTLCFARNFDEKLTLFLGNLSAAETVATTGTGNKVNKTNLLKAVVALLK